MVSVGSNYVIIGSVSLFIDSHITDLVYILPSYLKDTTDFLTKLSGCNVDSNDLLCTMKVSQLYPSISHSMSLEAMKHFLMNILHSIRRLSFCVRK